MNQLSGRQAIESSLTAIGQLLAYRGRPVSIVILGGAAMNLLGFVDRPTIDVDVLAREENGALRHPDPLPEELRDAIRSVARDRGLPEHWMNTTVAGQWHFGLPTGLAQRVHWRSFDALRVGLVDRRDLVFFKLYASADQTTPDNVHTKDLLALNPADDELEDAAAWVCEQDPSPDFHAVVGKVVAYVRAALR